VNTWTRAVVRGPQARRLLQGEVEGLAPVDLADLAAQRFLVADPEVERRSHEHWFLLRKFHPPLVTLTVAAHDGSTARVRLDAAGRAGTARLLEQALVEAAPPAATLRLVGGDPFDVSADCLDLVARARAAAAQCHVTLEAVIATRGVPPRSRGARALVQAVDTFELALGGPRASRRARGPVAAGSDPDAATLRAIALLAPLGKTIVLTLRRGARPWARRTAARILADVDRALGNAAYPKLRFRLGPLPEGGCRRWGPGGWPQRPHPAGPPDGAVLRQILADSPFAGRQDGGAGPEPVLPPALEQSGDLDLCSYLRGCALHVAASGDVLLCPAVPLSVGRVTREARLGLRRLRLTNADPFDDAECRACAFVPLCTSRCPLDARGAPRWRDETCRARAREALASGAARAEPAAGNAAAPKPVFAVAGPR
jgi:radical SAM protein with 4Fe4S-binding SPASM domain